MYVDSQTLAELEILHSQGGGLSIAQVIDRTRTRLGRRKLSERLRSPIADPELLRLAHQAYATLHDLALESDLDLDRALDGSLVDAVEKYLDSNLSTVADRGMLSGAIEAGWIALRYPELVIQARAGIDDARRLFSQLGALTSRLGAWPLEGDLARVMAGKTTYIRSVAICLYLAQSTLPVPAARFRFHPVEAFYTALSDEDDLRQGISSFMADLIRVRKILERVRRGERTFAVFDELFRGTNITDSAECLQTFLEGVLRCTTSGFVVSSHLAEVAERFVENSGFRPHHFAAEWDGKEASFDYTLRPGTSLQRLGRLLFRQEGLEELLA